MGCRKATIRHAIPGSYPTGLTAKRSAKTNLHSATLATPRSNQTMDRIDSFARAAIGQTIGFDGMRLIDWTYPRPSPCVAPDGGPLARQQNLRSGSDRARRVVV